MGSNVLNYFLVSFFLKYHGDFKENVIPIILELTQISTICGEKKMLEREKSCRNLFIYASERAGNQMS